MAIILRLRGWLIADAGLLRRRLLQAHSFVLNQGADGSCYGEADEVLAGSGGGDGAGLVGGVGSGSDDGRVADAVPAFCGEASGGGSGGDVALLVEGDYAYGSIFMASGDSKKLACVWFGRRSGGTRRDGEVFLLEFLDEILPAALGEEEAGRLLLEAGVDQKASAPAPIIITFCDLSMTARARAMGWRVCWTSATAPALRVAPSMMAASI